jgi:hypothetical protein
MILDRMTSSRRSRTAGRPAVSPLNCIAETGRTSRSDLVIDHHHSFTTLRIPGRPSW